MIFGDFGIPQGVPFGILGGPLAAFGDPPGGPPRSLKSKENQKCCLGSHAGVILNMHALKQPCFNFLFVFINDCVLDCFL